MSKRPFITDNLAIVADSLDSKGEHDFADEVDKIAFIATVMKGLGGGAAAVGKGIGKGVGALNSAYFRWQSMKRSPTLKAAYDKVIAQQKLVNKQIKDLQVELLRTSMPALQDLIKKMDAEFAKSQQAAQQPKPTELQATDVFPATSAPATPAAAANISVDQYINKVSDLATRLHKSGHISESQSIYQFAKKFKHELQ